MTSLVTEQTKAKKQEDIYNKINEVLTTGNFKIAKAAYEKCLEDCKDTEDYRKFEAGPPKKVMMMNPRRRREKNRARMASYKKAQMNYENCKQRCHKDWYMAIVGLIGQENTDLNEDVLVKINEMLQEEEQTLAKKKKKGNKKGGRKTRRKKGTKRKRKKSRRRRKSKRRN